MRIVGDEKHHMDECEIVRGIYARKRKKDR